MKKYAILMPLLLLMTALPVLAQTVNVIDNPEEVKISAKNAFDDGGGTIYPLPAPGARLTVLATHQASTVTTSKSLLGNLVIQQYVNGSWQTLYEDCPGIVTVADRTVPVVGTVIGHYEASVDYESLSVDLDRHATQIRFYNTNIATAKTIKDLRVTMATFIEVAPQTLDMGEVVVGTGDTTAAVHVTYCNVAQVRLSSTNPSFRLTATSLSGAGVAQYATEDAQLTFTPTVMGEHTTTLIATDNAGHTDSCQLRIRVTKRSPVFTWAIPAEVTVGDTIVAPISSDCENALALTTCDGEKLHISCGQLIATAPGEVSVQALQLGDEEYWYNRMETKSFTIVGEVPAPVVDTVIVHDTLVTEVHDTLVVEVHDTLVVEVHDTLVLRDTIVVLDTIYVNSLTTEERALLSVPMLRREGMTLVAEESGVTALVLYDAQGRLVRKEEGSERIVLSLDAVPNGYYVAVVVTAEQQRGIAVIIRD